MEFKIGDRVIGIGSYEGRLIDGEIGTVKQVSSYACAVHWDSNIGGWGDSPRAIPYGHGWSVDNTQLRLLNKKKS